MIRRLTTLLLTNLLLFAFAAVAAGQHTPRISLDWEPDPHRPSHLVVKHICGHPKVVALIGGTEIRRRVPSAR